MRLGVTRAAKQLSALSSRASKQGIEVVPLPFTQTKALPFEWPASISTDQVDWLFFTSSNGVRCFFARLDCAPFDSAQGEVLGAHTKIAAVGDKTAEALADLGYTVHFQPGQPVGEALFKEFVKANKGGRVLLWARARRVNFDPQELFALTEYKYYPVICYETIAHEVDKQIVAAFESRDYILFTAPSAVRAYNRKFDLPVAKLIAIGPTTAATMKNVGWTEFETMKQPDVDRALECL